ncbi:MAG: HAMP domain-containing sensor histidine kinase [Tissierellia bacterium]|nr:HAMP domain-containing sensor histidine kinase [Tissierellia bacterium]
MMYLILVVLFSILVFFTIKYMILKKALKKINRDLEEIERLNLTEKRLNLPIYDKDLNISLANINRILKSIQEEKIHYQNNELNLQKQIENISHDLRTPITAIIGYLDLIEKLNIDDHELMQYISIINNKSNQMNELISDFYEYSRLQSKDYKLSIKKIDLNVVLTNTIIDNYKLLEESKLEISTQIENQKLFVKCDKLAVERIFLNLLNNALKYSTSYIKIKMVKVDKSVEIIFENDSTLLDKKSIEHVFDRFYRADFSRSKKGSGLGLSIVKELSDKMNFKIEADISDFSNEKDVKIVKFKIKMPICRENKNK